jgi:hypothetical protein
LSRIFMTWCRNRKRKYKYYAGDKGPFHLAALSSLGAQTALYTENESRQH